MSSSSGKSILGAVLAAAVLSLLVNLVRLYGELQQWNPVVWSREPGGGNAPLGISWLVIVFGFWFGRRLAHNGHRPKSVGKVLLMSLIGMGVLAGAGYCAFTMIGPSPAEVEAGAKVTAEQWRTRALTFNAGAAVGGLLVLASWARGWLVLVVYGLLARAPVMAIQYFALENKWDTHFSYGPPGMPDEVLLFALTLAQAVFWPFGFTVLLGGLFGALGAATVRRC